jgi:hypothetical protein
MKLLENEGDPANADQCGTPESVALKVKGHKTTAEGPG